MNAPLINNTAVCPDRRSVHKGRTATANPGNLKVHYDAELKGLTCCTKLVLCCVCREFDKDRSYLYVRENSIEKNVASRCCCGGCCEYDHIGVHYFDRAPLKPECACYLGRICCIIPFPCCVDLKPKFEVLKVITLHFCHPLNVCFVRRHVRLFVLLTL